MIICQFLLCANVHLLSLKSHIFIRVGNTEREFSVSPKATQQMDQTGLEPCLLDLKVHFLTIGLYHFQVLLSMSNSEKLDTVSH